MSDGSFSVVGPVADSIAESIADTNISRRTLLAYSAGLMLWPALPAKATSSARQSSLSAPPTAMTANGIVVEFDAAMRTAIRSMIGGKPRVLTGFDKSEYLQLADGTEISDFKFVDGKVERFRHGTVHHVRGLSDAGVEKMVSVTIHNSAPGLAIIRTRYQNQGSQKLRVGKWVNAAHRLMPSQSDDHFWGWDGATQADRRDWVQRLGSGFSQDNFMGMNASDYGSGTPIVDVWRRDGGIAVGHLETVPQLVSLPVVVDNEGAALRIEKARETDLLPGASLETHDSFISVHQRDFYATLDQYRKVMADRGLAQAKPPASVYEPVWCAWGYDRNFDTKDIIATLPKAKQLGFVWAGLDDGWQPGEGDWVVDRKRFPRGDADMKAFVDAIKQQGMKAKLWIAPLAVDPGTDLLHKHSDQLLLDENGAVVDVSWWNAFTLCPAYQPVIDDAVALVRKAFLEWGYEGLKLDGQHLNGVAPCYNKAHKHKYPEESVEKLQLFWKAIYDEAMRLNPNAVVEICPCGTAYSFFNLPAQNQAVASDPLSSWQVRHKGKSLKALMGPEGAYCGDHVELSTGGEDFASSIGIGAVVASKFTLPGINIPEPKLALTPEKEKLWAKALDIYHKKMLPTGQYRGELYDIGFDKPEAHAVEKAGVMHYAFYADDWSGAVELRGLKRGRYRVTDYWNGTDLGIVSADNARLDVRFKDFILIEAKPVKA